MENYFIIDIETCPLDLEEYFKLEEEERFKLINPIDSKIVAIGIKHKGNTNIFMEGDEKKILVDFWSKWKEIKSENSANLPVGFNISSFDIPFLISRSFIHNVTIVPFVMKSIVDLREKINAYRYGKTKGKLTDYAKLTGLDIPDMDGSKVAELCKDKNFSELRKYLESDLNTTEHLLKRAHETNILHINRW